MYIQTHMSTLVLRQRRGAFFIFITFFDFVFVFFYLGAEAEEGTESKLVDEALYVLLNFLQFFFIFILKKIRGSLNLALDLLEGLVRVWGSGLVRV